MLLLCLQGNVDNIMLIMWKTITSEESGGYMNDNDKTNRNDGHTKEIFEKQFGSIENYSRQAVKELVDDIPSTEPTPEPVKPPYKRSGKHVEDEYEAYLNSASRYNQEEAEKRKNQRDAAIVARDKALESGWPKADFRRSQTAPLQPLTDAEYEKMEVSRISRIHEKPARAKNTPGTLNMRNILAVGALIILFIFAMLVWWIASMNTRMSSAIEELDELQGRYNVLQVENQDLQMQLYAQQNQPPSNIVQLPILGDENQYNDDYNYLDPGQPAAQLPGEPVHNQPPALRTHTVQAGETLSSISRHFFGSTARINDIVALNNLPNPDNVPIDTVLQIPNN